MKYTVVITERAVSDLFEAMEWWARHRSVIQAERWYVGIREAIDGLVDTVEQHAAAPESSALRRDLREMHFGLGARPTHRVVFDIQNQIIRVLAVRHGARDRLRPGDLE